MRFAFTQRLTLAALMCALTAVCAQVQLPVPPVPISLALLGVYLCGALLGSRWGAAALGAYVLLGAAGLPVFAGFAGGVSVLFGPTGGFLSGYVLCTAVTGFLSRRLGFTQRGLMLAMAAGTAVCYLCGTAWFMLTGGAEFLSALSVCVFPFLPGDAVKIFLAARLCLRLKPALRGQAFSA